jgi:hypothetical protein
VITASGLERPAATRRDVEPETVVEPATADGVGTQVAVRFDEAAFGGDER